MKRRKWSTCIEEYKVQIDPLPVSSTTKSYSSLSPMTFLFSPLCEVQLSHEDLSFLTVTEREPTSYEIERKASVLGWEKVRIGLLKPFEKLLLCLQIKPAFTATLQPHLNASSAAL